jgi:hypothetical protein
MGSWNASWSSSEAVAATRSMRQSSVRVFTRWVLRDSISCAVFCYGITSQKGACKNWWVLVGLNSLEGKYGELFPLNLNLKTEKTSSIAGYMREWMGGVRYENQPMTHLGCSSRTSARAVTMGTSWMPWRHDEKNVCYTIFSVEGSCFY